MESSKSATPASIRDRHDLVDSLSRSVTLLLLDEARLGAPPPKGVRRSLVQDLVVVIAKDRQ